MSRVAKTTWEEQILISPETHPVQVLIEMLMSQGKSLSRKIPREPESEK
jgi:hypothetical protein